MMSFSYTDDRIRKTLRDMFMRREQTFRGDERGSALIEAAILTPLLIVLFVGVFKFLWFFYQQHLVAIGLHDAVSYLARSADPCNPTSRVWKTNKSTRRTSLPAARLKAHRASGDGYRRW
jgi:Flp pilus assembly protein TadG